MGDFIKNILNTDLYSAALEPTSFRLGTMTDMSKLCILIPV